MIVFDTETTGLELKGQKLAVQPHIIELGAIKLDNETLEEVSRMSFMCKPPILIPAEAMNVHHITDEMVADLPPFAAFVEELQEFFLGERFMVAHNCAYDMKMLSFALQRIEMVQRFPWPPTHICTVERSHGIKGRRLKLGQLHEIATGEDFSDKHRAIADTEALVRCVRYLRKEGKL